MGEGDPHFSHSHYGDVISNLIIKLDLVLLEYNSPTEGNRVPTFKGREKGSWIDHIMISSSHQASCIKYVISQSSISDHNPILFILTCNVWKREKTRIVGNMEVERRNGISVKCSEVNVETFMSNLVKDRG